MTQETGAARMSRSQAGAFTVLFVCTGNICRSALAERLGRAYVDAELGGQAGEISLHSAGTGAVVGSGMHPDTALVLAGLGGNPQGHVARQLTSRMVLDADLVLTMTRAHRTSVLQAAPRALGRTFMLREAAALVADLSPEVLLPGDGLPERARGLVQALGAARPGRRSTGEDDIADPIGRPLAVQQEVGEQVAGALLAVLERLVLLREDAPPAVAEEAV